MKTHIQLAIYTRIFPTYCACQRINVKRKGEDHHDSYARQEIKVKDRPFAEGSRGFHALLWLDAQSLNARERHFILPLVIWTFIMQSVTFISSTSHDRIKLIFSHTNKSYIFREHFLLLAPMTTYLEDLTQSIGRYGGLSWQNWFKGIWKHKQYLYLVR